MAKLLFIGDVHGNWQFMLMNLKALQNKGIIWDKTIQCGDFGFYQGCIGVFPKSQFKHFTKYKNQKMVENPLPEIHFIKGNHEDHVFLKTATNVRKTFGGTYIEDEKIWNIDNTKIAFLGGALNVDRDNETDPPNYVTLEQVESFSKKINDIGGVDIIVTHSCPGGIGIGIKGKPYFQKTSELLYSQVGYKNYPIHDVGEEPLTMIWEKLIVKPKNWIFAHMHVVHTAKVGTTNFYCIGCADNFDIFSPLMLDTITGELYK